MSTTLLGKNTDYPDAYNPGLLTAIPRAGNRKLLGLSGELPFTGSDVWHAYEISWLNMQGLPQLALGKFSIDCLSPNLIESKSLKLYLNSHNQERYKSQRELQKILTADLSAAAGSVVEVELIAPQESSQTIDTPTGICLDDQEINIDQYLPSDALLHADTAKLAEETLYTNLFRSNCPITNQPDWATVTLAYKGPTISHADLLRYLVSYRLYNGYHESCVEKIFFDVQQVCQPEILTVQANFLRRGGLDINPLRSNGGSKVGYFPRFVRQ